MHAPATHSCPDAQVALVVQAHGPPFAVPQAALTKTSGFASGFSAASGLLPASAFASGLVTGLPASERASGRLMNPLSMVGVLCTDEQP